MQQGTNKWLTNNEIQLIKYDGKSHELQSKSEKFRYELYKENQENDERSWEFSGLINHSLSIQHAAEASAGTERALEALKNTMASIEQDREARK
jgi:RNA polymerase II elongation factor ELL